MASFQTERWLKVAANLNIASGRGSISPNESDVAPHKPLLLLVIAELAERGKLTNPLLLSSELAFLFLSYCNVVAHRRTQKLEIYLPFFHLTTDGIWTAFNGDGRKTTKQTRRFAREVRIDEGFFACLHDADFREQLRRELITERYFADPAERAALYDLVGALPDNVVQKDTKIYTVARQRGRDARFRVTVISAYDHTCALTRFRLITVDGSSMVDAAHIHQFSDSRNNHPQNGIALCKNAHWMFDQGLWSLDDDYRVLVASSHFHESGNDGLALKMMQNKQILLPANPTYRPDKRYLAWHRREKFKAIQSKNPSL